MAFFESSFYFEIKPNRCFYFHLCKQDNILITAGEGGIVTVWENLPTSKIDNHTLKEKVNTKTSRKSKPY